MAKIFKLYILVCLFVITAANTKQVKHPQHIDLSDIDDDDLLNWSARSNGREDCLMFYRRLVKHLFKKERFQLDPGSSKSFIASVPLRLNKEQWELLVNNDIDGLNANEVNNLLEEVLKQSNDWDYPVTQILFDHYRHQLIESLPSLNSPAVLICVAVLVIIVMNRMFNFSKLTFSAMILLVFLSIVAISYTMTYRDCLSDLEVEQMIQLTKKNSPNNPCKDYDAENESFLKSIRALVIGSSENKCLEHMRKTFKTSKNFCDPLDVFMQWLGKIQMSYFTSILNGFLEVVASVTSGSNFLTKSIFWAAASFVFVFVMVQFIKSIIKHGFRGLFNMLNTTKVTAEPPEQSRHDIGLLHLKMDEILHENRQMKRELSIIRECSEDRSLQPSSPKKIRPVPRLSDIEDEDDRSLQPSSPKKIKPIPRLSYIDDEDSR